MIKTLQNLTIKSLYRENVFVLSFTVQYGACLDLSCFVVDGEVAIFVSVYYGVGDLSKCTRVFVWRRNLLVTRWENVFIK
jgi:hypothetical protein